MGTFFPSMLLSGVIWPIEAIPEWLRYISYALPTTWAAESMRSVMLRGWVRQLRHLLFFFFFLGGLFYCTARGTATDTIVYFIFIMGTSTSFRSSIPPTHTRRVTCSR